MRYGNWYSGEDPGGSADRCGLSFSDQVRPFLSPLWVLIGGLAKFRE